MSVKQRDAMLATCIRALPNEGCGLLVGTLEGFVHDVVASANIADSARIYEIDPAVVLAAARRADAEGLEVIGVFHSHTHSAAYPSPTDVAQAPDPSWHYVLISLGGSPAEIMSYRIVGGEAAAEVLDVTKD
jgi:proteasome lid subunit RPN8/RPN11